ncbi:lipoate synthase [Paraburkholderia sp. WSM4179]|nr:lipoate synthase [Paraburkholderia sp. WSM4179]
MHRDIHDHGRDLHATMRDLRAHDVDVLTIGQYLAPSRFHMAVRRYMPPATFDMRRDEGLKMGFMEAASGPLVRSSYHADRIAGML